MTIERYCIIGAGASGIAVAKSFGARGIAFDLVEREADIGGAWNLATRSGVVHEASHLDTAIATTAFEDYPVAPGGAAPIHPGQAWVLGYLKRYAQAFGIGAQLQTGQTVVRVAPRSAGGWQVQVAGEALPRDYAGVVIASGPYDKPRQPEFAGHFNGETISARAFRSARQLAGERVLVIGAGDEGSAIVTEAAYVAGAVTLSMRDGKWFVPQFMLGRPSSEVMRRLHTLTAPLPRMARAHLEQALVRLVQGRPSRYGLPEPAQRIDRGRVTMSDAIPRLAAQGRLVVKPAVERLAGDEVVFVDGTRAAFDTIVLATGYEPSVPFVERSLLFDGDGAPKLALGCVLAEHPGLYVAGSLDAGPTAWRLAALQGQLIAQGIVAETVAPDEALAFREAIGRAQASAADAPALERNLRKTLRLFKRTRELQVPRTTDAGVGNVAKRIAAE